MALAPQRHPVIDIDQAPIVAYGRATGGNLSIPRLLAAAREPNPAKRSAQLEAVLDVERFARLFALRLREHRLGRHPFTAAELLDSIRVCEQQIAISRPWLMQVAEEWPYDVTRFARRKI